MSIVVLQVNFVIFTSDIPSDFNMKWGLRDEFRKLARSSNGSVTLIGVGNVSYEDLSYISPNGRVWQSTTHPFTDWNEYFWHTAYGCCA